MKFIFGLLVLAIGIYYLGINFLWWEKISWQWDNLWQYWPILLILFGVSLFGRRSKNNWLWLLLSIIIIIAAIVDWNEIKASLSSINIERY